MNRYPLWKYLLIGGVLALGLLYTLPNFFGETPAVQISAGKTTIQVEPALVGKVEKALQDAKLAYRSISFDAVGQQNSVRVRVADTDTQLKVKAVVETALNPDVNSPDYVVALNLLPATPSWLSALNAQPMYLGLDLRGGVHFLLQVDLKAAVLKKIDTLANDARDQLRNKKVRHGGVIKTATGIEVRLRDAETLDQAKSILRDGQPDLEYTTRSSADEFTLVGTLKPQAQQRTLEYALKQNMTTLHNRINELGVAEPIIQQQGLDRIVVQLPGVQDVSRAKSLIGRTATLEVRMVDEAAQNTGVSAGPDVFPERQRNGSVMQVPMQKQVVLTGDQITDAQATFDSNQQAAVSVELDSAGGRIMRDLTRANVGKLMAIILFEKGKGEAISVARINGEFSNRFQITGSFSPVETNNLSILLRAGSLAAPMEIIEERVIGPSLGAENISKGFNSTLYGFIAIAVFMLSYYLLFGGFSVFALAANLLLLVALLSLLQATLTLPGIAAIALTLGMAIDANVLINERIREELRHGNTPQAAITAGYEHAWATILDSNITTLIAGLALLIFGSGAVRGFAVVHCLGILTSMFSSVLVSRAAVNLWYGRQKKVSKLAIGQVWRAQ